jgi:Spy/CpxP family protein refolding chaperone
MKLKLMPLLAGLITLSAVATPLIVKAQADTSAQAQPAQTTRQPNQGKWNKLGLSDAQKQQLRQIHDNMRAEIYKTVLTPQQQAQLDTARQNRQARQGGKRGFMASLNLTDAQKAKIKAIREAYKPRLQAVLTPEQQQRQQQMRQQRQQQRQQRQQQQNKQ